MLTDAKIKAAKPADRDYKLADSGQLFLHVTTAGGRHWRMNYSFGKNAAGKPAQKTLTFGSYPALTLVDARARRDEAKALLREGRDPAVERRVATAAKATAGKNTFEIVAEQWFELKSGWSVKKFRAWRAAHGGKWHERDAANWIERPQAGWSVVHSGDVLKSLDNDVFPSIGDLPIGEIESPKVLEVLNAIVQRGAIETAHRVCQRIGDVYVYAIPAGLAKANPAASMGKALPKVPRSKKQPSIIDRIREHEDQIKVVRQMLRDCDDERCRASTKFALRLLALTAVRPNEIQNAEWSEFEDLDGPAPLWRIPASRMKGDLDRKADEDGDHLVPLSTQAVELVQTLRMLTGNYRLMFPSERHPHRPISENTLRALLIRAGYYQRHVPHGFRAAFSTIMNERPDKQEGDRAVIDLMLAHVPKDKVEGAYNRASYMPRRREIAQAWADIITEGLEAPAEHIGKPIRWADTSPKAPRKTLERVG
ncbi:integrase [Sphingopyxis sp. QXT-31]|uniref:tyrosine-type recombinase/integrase n=1 Tax=Sphingopyxis sp. QXT-31 TaxID=1357916 RepID=UPI0009796A26|nr:integrase arm-type DNA-binding domain-containing protein [Sphingopyxis sp. QXT-31]APZ98040.1 integrase [Sphingopyxis sp. QXT-31]